MGFVTILIMAIALGTDAFSLAIGIGMRGVTNREIIRASVVIGIFHIFMPLAGLYLGRLFGQILGSAASIIGAIILIYLGIRMVRAGLKPDPAAKNTAQLYGWPLILFALSVSLDALSVGFGLGTFMRNIIQVVLTFGITSLLMTAVGLRFGNYLGLIIGERAELIGGLVLVVVGARVLL